VQGFRYAARLKPENEAGVFTVTFRDVPEAITWGRGLPDALWQAADCVEEAIAGRLRGGDPIPVPSRPRRGEMLIDVPALTAAKAALYVTMKEAGVRPAQLARKLGWDAKEISRLLDPRHAARQATMLSKMEKALNMLGKRLVIAIDEAA
jgi:antitoxin HicB